MKNRINDPTEGIPKAINGAETKGKPIVVRVPASEAAWNAGQEHELRADNFDLSQQLLNRDQIIIKKDQIIIALRQQLHAFEIEKLTQKQEEVNKKNAALREAHGLVVGRQLKKDPETGEIYWLVTEPADPEGQ